MSHLESLTKKLHALLPELTECAFGRGIKLEQEPELHLTYEGVTIPVRPETIWIILAKTINLEHVLKALGILAKAEYLGMRMACDGSTLLLWWTLMLSGFHERAKEYPWQLGLPLDQQSPETIEFLDNLIPEQK